MVSSRPELDVRVRGWRAGQPDLVVISGDMPVAQQDVAQVLELRLDGTRLDYTLTPLSTRQLATIYASPKANAFAVVPKRWPAARGTLVLSLLEGLRSSAGPERGEAETLLRLPVNEPLRLVGIACNWSRMPMTPAEAAKAPVKDCRADAELSLAFTRPLAEGEAERIAAALPDLTFKLQPTSCGAFCGEVGARFPVNFTSEAAGITLPITLPADLRADDGSLIELAAAPNVVFRDHARSVRGVPGTRLLRPGADAAIALEARNLASPATLAASTGNSSKAATCNGPFSDWKNPGTSTQLIATPASEHSSSRLDR